MLMRKIPLRGEKLRLATDGTLVTILEMFGKDRVNVILPNGNLAAVLKNDLDLPTINTSYYEKIRDH